MTAEGIVRRKLRFGLLAGIATAFCCGLAGLLIGGAVQLDHPHQRGWTAPYWASGTLIGLAVGLGLGALVGAAVYDTARPANSHPVPRP